MYLGQLERLVKFMVSGGLHNCGCVLLKNLTPGNTEGIPVCNLACLLLFEHPHAALVTFSVTEYVPAEWYKYEKGFVP